MVMHRMFASFAVVVGVWLGVCGVLIIDGLEDNPRLAVDVFDNG